LRREPGWRAFGTATACLAGWQVLAFTVGGGLLPGDANFYLFLLGLFGWFFAVIASYEDEGLWNATLWWGVLAIVLGALPGMVMQYGEDLRAKLPEDARKRRDQPVVGVHLFCAALIVVLAGRLYPERWSRAPFDAAMLARYRIFERIGAFGVDLESPRGAAQFLTAARSILASSDGMLWITAQGRFADARARPLALRPGVARLAEIAPDALFVPLAVEYTFWDERGAGAFVAFGPGIGGSELAALPRDQRLARLESDLTATLDRLSADVISREPGRFRTLVSGRKGVGGLYDLWRRVAARLSGRRFDPAHRAAGGQDRAG
jgi:hypothetical protein